MSARDLAFDAAWTELTSTDVQRINAAINAASDVWEPLLRELHDAFGEARVSFEFADDEVRNQSTRLYKAWITARRALGIEDT